MRIPDNILPNYGRISSAVILQKEEREGQEETCLPTSLALLLGYLGASSSCLQDLRLGFSLGYQMETHLVMAQVRRQISCKWMKRRAIWSIVALLPWQCCLATCQRVYSHPQANGSSPPYEVFISSGLWALYRCPLRGPPLSPARRRNGSCKCVRS